MILIYTGNGKGKTSASVGQAIRAHGQGLTVAFGQFMKRSGQAGEQKVLSIMLENRFLAGGPGFFRDEEERGKHREAALDVLRWAEDMLASADMLVLDEILYAHGYGLVSENELRNLTEKARTAGAHLVLSGRGLPVWLEREADLVTEMTEKKHHFTEGRPAVPGIEF